MVSTSDRSRWCRQDFRHSWLYLILAVGHSYALLIRSISIFATLGTDCRLPSPQGRGRPEIRRRGLPPSCVLTDLVRVFDENAFLRHAVFFHEHVASLGSDSPGFFADSRRGTGRVVDALCPAVARLNPTQVDRHRVGRWDFRVAGDFLVSGAPVGQASSGDLPPVDCGRACRRGAWMLWAERHPVSIWPVHGFQESYVAQLRLKNGNNPELGMATWRDVLKRPLENEDDMATSMAGLLTHKQIAPAWYSPATVIPLALLLIGLASSFRKTGGGITEWYFVGYQFLYLFWPWDFELRFQLPIAPLAALYIWRGGQLILAAGSNDAPCGRSDWLHDGCDWHPEFERLGLAHPPSSRLGVHRDLGAAGCLSAVILLGGRELMRKLSLLSGALVSFGGVHRVSAAKLAGAVSMACLLGSRCLDADGGWRGEPPPTPGNGPQY